MFKAKLKDASVLKDSIDTISELIHEGLFKVSSDSLYLKASDRATVAVVDFELMSDAFEELKCDEEKKIGVNLENLLEILKRVKGKDSLRLELKEDESKLKIIIEGASKRTFEIPLLSLSEGEVPETSQLEFPAKLQLKSSLLKSGVSDAEIVSDSVVFMAEDGKFNMEAGRSSSSVKIETEKDSDDLIEIKADEKVKSRYPIEYLQKMLKASKISDVASLDFGSDYPMRLEFSEPEKVKMSFVLAPRVED